MKYQISLIGIIAFLFFLLNSCFDQSDLPVLKGPYLGQKPPGLKAEIFAPGIVSTSEHEYGIAFSRDVKEIYLKRVIKGEGKNLFFYYEKNRWNGPREVKFSVEGRYGQLHITSDGKHLLANHITTGQEGKLTSTIVKFSRKNDMWCNPITIGPGMRATSGKSGSVYVTHVADPKRNFGVIGLYKQSGNKYKGPKIFGEEINHKEFSSAHPFIAADESYLIFDSKREGKSGGLFISFNLGKGSWSKAIDLSEKLNTGKNVRDWYATVSPDSKYLFFSSGERGKSDIYWVDAKIIEKLRPKNLK